MDTPKEPAAPVTGRNARRASTACLNCRRSKRKCDFARRYKELNACSNCYHKCIECTVPRGHDKRNRRSRNLLPPEPVVLVHRDLRHRAYSAQTAGLQASNPNALLDMASMTCPATMLEDTQRHESPLNSGIVGAGQSAFGPSDTHPMHAENASFPSASESDCLQDSPGTAGIHTDSISSREDMSSESIIDRVTSREGGLDSERKGQLTYFGPTSIIRLARIASTGRDDAIENANNTDAPVNVEPDYDTSLEPEPIVQHLLDLFWEWQAPYLQVLHKRLFLAHKQLYDTDQPRNKSYECFTPSVLYAVLAMASLISPDRGVRRYSSGSGTTPGHIYSEKAKYLLDKEMAHPTILTIQCALVLASRYGALGETTLGWVYCGIASRICSDLGLYADKGRIDLDRGISEEMAEVRQTVFWGCYVQDKLWSVYCGRPSGILDDYISIKQPYNHGDLSSQAEAPDTVLMAVHHHIIILSVQCSRIHLELYSTKNGNNHDLLRKAAETIHADLVKWHSNLPEALQWPNEASAPGLPHTLVMHMQFHFCLLLLHRPFMRFKQPTTRSDRVIVDSGRVCTLAASNITKLIREYSRLFDIRIIASPAVHFVFIAATVHLVNIQLTKSHESQTLFQWCLLSLKEMGASYPHSGKAVDVLKEAQRFYCSGADTMSLGGVISRENSSVIEWHDAATSTSHGSSEHSKRNSGYNARSAALAATAEDIESSSGLNEAHEWQPIEDFDLDSFDWNLFESPVDFLSQAEVWT